MRATIEIRIAEQSERDALDKLSAQWLTAAATAWDTQTVAPDPRVDPGWLSDHLDDPRVRIIEVDVSPASYEDGHIPGANLWDAYQDLRHPDYTPIDPDEFDVLLSRSGIAPESTVVLYGYAPYLGFWLLERHGHEGIRLMDGPRERWEASGHRWDTGAPEPSPSDYSRSGERPELVVGYHEVEEMIDDPRTVLVDVRSKEEFNGERFWPSGATEGAGRPGHIPRALHVTVELAHQADGSLADGEELRRECDRLGIDRGQRVVTYCTIGNRASEVAFALRRIGYADVANQAGRSSGDLTAFARLPSRAEREQSRDGRR